MSFFMLPQNYLDKWKLRHQAEGNERRRNMCKIILEDAANFPKAVSYSDIDHAFQEWVDKSLEITYNGKRLPTFKLFSNQRINEYAQSWKHVDEVGNLLLNFKTVTRDNNPQKGENQGSYYNIPGNRDYPLFMVPVLQENGQQAYDMYSMKQPFCVDMLYTFSIITNNYEVINIMNELVHDKFKAINAYIAPNGHFMPMTLENISDESEYSLDDRKYYSQNFQVKVKAYIIKESDFTVTNIPSRAVVRGLGLNSIKKAKVQIEEEDYYMDPCHLREIDDPYYNKKINLIVNLPTCTKEADFIFDTNMLIREITTDNVYDFIIKVNGEKQTFETDVLLEPDDKITVLIERDEYDKDSVVTIVGFDPTEVIDKRYDPESSLDEKPDTEEIIFNA